MEVSEKKLCREFTKDALAHALVKIYGGEDAKMVIDSMLNPEAMKSTKDDEDYEYCGAENKTNPKCCLCHGSGNYDNRKCDGIPF